MHQRLIGTFRLIEFIVEVTEFLDFGSGTHRTEKEENCKG